ncbi:hypothetical protein NDU88_001719 [Pleurodeles waltl]|uniref:Uncharacterized protein n=1 Tax=Pleurodeles waltl TaxID=8319 RepID=A0AAV7VCR3_PLEWA|nr:hypothetical protein NDU88_001719 [Pleurodeles waltl]
MKCMVIPVTMVTNCEMVISDTVPADGRERAPTAVEMLRVASVGDLGDRWCSVCLDVRGGPGGAGGALGPQRWRLGRSVLEVTVPFLTAPAGRSGLEAALWADFGSGLRSSSLGPDQRLWRTAGT